MTKVFLGGTCNDSRWREEIKRMLKIDYFDPIVDDWDEAAYQREMYEREYCDFCLYVITPKMTGVYAIAEAIDDSNKRPQKALFCYLIADDEEVFTNGQQRSLQRVVCMIEDNGGKVFGNLADVAEFLNTSAMRLHAQCSL